MDIVLLVQCLYAAAAADEDLSHHRVIADELNMSMPEFYQFVREREEAERAVPVPVPTAAASSPPVPVPDVPRGGHSTSNRGGRTRFTAQTASKAAREAHRLGLAHQFTPETARAAALLGQSVPKRKRFVSLSALARVRRNRAGVNC